MSYTAYCLLAPRLKERRFETRYGARFRRYRDRVPYILPRPRKSDQSPVEQPDAQ
jgi:protein-S-isoprenylcysteine O-methyltransferase Ste14